jgi:tetratricopeptide (TPR) repeat protein
LTAADDAHGRAVRELAEVGNWAGLVRYWMGHRFYSPAMREAVRVARQGGGSARALLADYLDAVRAAPSDPAPFPEVLPPLTAAERVTIELLLSLPRILFCETASSAPAEDRHEYLRMGVEAAADAAVSLAPLGELPLTAFLFALQGRALEQLGEVGPSANRMSAAVAIRRGIARADPVLYGPELGRTLDHLGRMLGDAGEYERAVLCLEEASAAYELADTAGADTRAARAATLARLGILLSDLGRGSEAAGRLSGSVSIRRQLAETDPGQVPPLGRGLSTLGAVLTECRRLSEAETCLREAVELLRAGGPHDDLGGALTNLGNLLVEASRWGEAEAALTAAVEVLNTSDDEPALATALSRLGAVLNSTGRHAGAVDCLGRAIAIRRALAPDSPREFEPKLGNVLNSLGNACCDLREWSRAIAAYEEAGALLARHECESPLHAAMAAMVFNNLGTARLERGEFTEALVALDGAIERYSRLAAVAPDVYAPDLAMSLGNRANALREAGRHADALADYDAAVDLYRSAPSGLAEAVEPSLAQLLGNRGAVLRDLNRLTEAREDYESIVMTYAGLAAREPAAFEPDLARNLSNLGVILASLGEHEAAVDRCGEALALWDRCSARSPGVHEGSAANTWANLTVPLRNLGRAAEALSAAEQAAGRYRRLMVGEPRLAAELGRVLNNRGVILSILGEHNAAVGSFRESLAVRGGAGDLLAEPPAGTVGTWNNLAAAVATAGDTAAALGCYRDALDAARRLVAAGGGAHVPDLAMTLTNMGGFAWSVGRTQDAIVALREAVELYRALAGREPAAFGQSLGAALINLGGALADSGEAEAAIGAYESALMVIGERPGPDPDRAAAHLNLGNLLRRLGDLSGADRHLRTAADLYNRLAAGDQRSYRPDAALAWNNLGAVDERRGEIDSARLLYRKAIGLLESASHDAEVLYAGELAMCWANLGDLEADRAPVVAPEAREAYRRAVGYAEVARRRPRADLRQRRHLLSEYRDVYDRLAEAALLAWEADAAGADAVAAAEAAELGRARNLAELLADEFLPPAADPEAVEQVRRAWLRRRFAALTALTASDPGVIGVGGRYR